MKKSKFIAIACIILFLLFFKFYGVDFFEGIVKKIPSQIENMDVKVEVNDKKQYVVTEKIKMHFYMKNEIIRTSLMANQDTSYYTVSNVSISGINNEIYSNDYILLNYNGTGNNDVKDVTIKYTVNCCKDEDKTKDNMIIDVLRSQWPMRIDHFNAVIIYPHEMKIKNLGVESKSYYNANHGTKHEQNLDKAECKRDGNVIKVKADNIMYIYTPITVRAEFPDNAFKNAPQHKFDCTVNNEETNIEITKSQEYLVNKKYKISVNSSGAKVNLRQFLKTPDTLDISNVKFSNDKLRYEQSTNDLFLPDEKGVYDFTLSYKAVPHLDSDISFELRDIASYTNVEKSKLTIKTDVPINDYNILSNIRYDVNKKDNVITVQNDESLKSTGTLSVDIMPDTDSFTRKAPITAYVSIITSLLFVLTAIFRFIKYGKDPEIIPVVGVYPPQGLNSAEAAFLVNGYVKSSDVASLIFYWASHKHLNIVMDASDKSSFTLEKVSDLDNNHKDYEKDLFNSIFNSGDGRTVTCEMLKRNLLGDIMKIKLRIAACFIGEKRLDDEIAKSKSIRTSFLCCLTIIPLFITRILAGNIEFDEVKLVVMIFVSFLSMIIFYSFALCLNNLYKMSTGKKIRNISVVILAAVIVFIGNYKLYSHRIIPWYITGGSIILMMAGIFISAFITRISSYKEKIAGEVLGFKDFMMTAEKERLEMLINEDPDYFYDVLPYAQSLDVTNVWTDKFKDITLIPPSWYKSAAEFTLKVILQIILELVI